MGDGALTVLRGLLHSSTWSLALRVTNVAVAFGVAALLARGFSPRDLGAYFLVMSAAALLSIVAQWGAGALGLAGVARALAHGQGEVARDTASQALGRAIRGGLLVAGACTLAAGMSIPVLDASAVIIAVACGVVAFSLAMQGTGSEVLRAFGRPIPSTLFSGVLVNALLLSALAIASREGRLTLFAGLVLVMACYAVASCVVIWIFTRDGIPVLPRVAPAAAGRESRVVVANSFAAVFYSNSDLWIAGVLLSLQDAALYGAASRLALLLLLPVEAMETATAPMLPRLRAGGHDALHSTIVRTTQVQAAAVATGIFLLWVAGEVLLSIAFGSHYEGASGVLLALAAGLGVRAAMGPSGYMLLLTGHARALLKCNLLAVALFVPLQIAAAYWGGLTGLAIGSAFAMGATSVALACMSKRLTGFNLTALTLQLPARKRDATPS